MHEMAYDCKFLESFAQGGNRSAISKKEFLMNTKGYSSISWSPHCCTLLFLMNPSHAERSNVTGQQSDCDDNVSQCSVCVCLGRGGSGASVRERMSFGEWDGGRVRYGESCHVIFPVIPGLLLWKHSHSFWIPDPCCCGNLTDDRASLTPHQSPPTLHPLGYLSWLGWVYLEAN